MDTLEYKKLIRCYLLLVVAIGLFLNFGCHPVDEEELSTNKDQLKQCALAARSLEDQIQTAEGPLKAQLEEELIAAEECQTVAAFRLATFSPAVWSKYNMDQLSINVNTGSKKKKKNKKKNKKKKKVKTKSTPPQTEVDELIEVFTSLVLGQGGEVGEQCLASCSEIEKLRQNQGSFSCSKGGKIKLAVGKCNPKGNIAVRINAKKCDNGGGNTLNGLMIVRVAVNSKGVTAKLIANNFQLRGYSYYTKNIKAKLPCENGINGNPTCSGKLRAGKGKCNMAKDCSACKL